MTRREDVLAVRAKGDRREKLRGEAEARELHAEKLQAARDEERKAEAELERLHHWDSVVAIARLIDAKVELALLERGK